MGGSFSLIPVSIKFFYFMWHQTSSFYLVVTTLTLVLESKQYYIFVDTTATTKVNTTSTEISTASFSDATVYAFLSTQPKWSQLVHEDLEQLHDDDLKEMNLKWNMVLLSMRAIKFYRRTGRKIIIDGSNTAGYDKSKDRKTFPVIMQQMQTSQMYLRFPKLMTPKLDIIEYNI
ncbi:hypothetical protein Tco_0256539 [Tanacetum coccineum]